MQKRIFKITAITLAAILASGCSSVFKINEDIDFKNSFPNDKVMSENKKLEDLKDWWRQFEDEDLIKIIEMAQKNSPTISSALLNIKSYELSLGLNNAKQNPNLSVGANLSRSSSGSENISNYGSVGLQTSWELDLFNKFGTEKKINLKKLEGANAQWHEAQVLVAANTAKSYYSYRLCKEALSNLNEDYAARLKQQELTKLNVAVGLENKSAEYLSQARISQAENSLISKEVECETEFKGLVALTGVKEDILIEMVSNDRKINLNFEIPKMLSGDLIIQRPDVYAAKKNLESAFYNLEFAKKQNLPSISIVGNISSNYIASNGFSTNGTSWSVGPLSLYLPIFDGGRIKSNEIFADAQINNQRIIFENTLRQATKEIEVTLLNLSRIEEKRVLIEDSVNNYEKLYSASLKKYQVGLSSLYELEDAKISYLNAKNQKVNNKKETLNYWIDLYKAIGGGFKGKTNEK